MKPQARTLGVLLALVLTLQAVPTKTNTIPGPALTADVSGYNAAGIAFTALQDSILTSFVFQNQGRAGTIALFASDSFTILYSVRTPAANSSYTVNGIKWTLTAGQSYYLVDLSYPSNGKYGAATFPVSDANIRVIAGVFEVAGSDFGSSTRTEYWAIQ